MLRGYIGSKLTILSFQIYLPNSTISVSDDDDNDDDDDNGEKII